MPATLPRQTRWWRRRRAPAPVWRTFGDDHWRTAETKLSLGKCLRSRGVVDEATTLFSESYEVLKEVRGEDHRLTKEAKAGIVGSGIAKKRGNGGVAKGVAMMSSLETSKAKSIVTLATLVTAALCGEVFADITNDQINRLNLQHHLDYRVPFADATFLGTHNSYNNLDDGYVAGPNHHVSIEEQLNKGVRLLNYDITVSGNTVKMCHNLCLGGEDTFRTGLNTLGDWLATNPNEVVLLVIQDDLDGNSDYDKALDAISGTGSTIKDYVYRRSDHPGGLSGCQDVPLTLTKQMVRDADRNVVVASFGAVKQDRPNCNQGGHQWRDWVWGAPLLPVPKGNPRPSFVNTIKRYPHVWSTAAEDRLIFLPSYLPYFPNDISTALQRGAGLIGLDFWVDPNDFVRIEDSFAYSATARSEALIWSWSANQPDISNNKLCAAQDAGGKWSSRGCSENLRHACQHSDTGSWALSAVAGSWNDGDSACQGLGSKYRFSTPVNGNLNENLRIAKNGIDVWINHFYDSAQSSWVTRHHVSRQETLFSAASGTIHYVGANGNAQIKVLKIPEDTPYGQVDFTLKGGDGGSTKITYESCVFPRDTRTRGGGGGAVVSASFAIGDAPGEIAPGSSIGFVPADHGTSHTLEDVLVCDPTVRIAVGGGGGGTGVLVFDPESGWKTLAVAGGGAGSRINSVGNSQAGRPGGTDTSGADGTTGGCGGNDCLTLVSSGGGGGLDTVGQGLFCLLSPNLQAGGGGTGRYIGSPGGSVSGLCFGPYSSGGFGFGAGGSSGDRGSTAVSGGGGGGGYKGGNGGAYPDGGHGGGSFVARMAVASSADEGPSTNSPGPGYIQFSFVETNDPPVAVADSYGAVEDTDKSVNASNGVLSNDTDADGDTLTAVEVSTTSHGTLTLNGDGSFTYSSLEPDYCGPDSFTYYASDGEDDSATVTVSLDVACVNDPPLAINDTATTAEDTPVDIDVIANDTDVDNLNSELTVSSIANVTNGTATLQPGGRIVRFTPAANLNSDNTASLGFTYLTSDGVLDAVFSADVSVTVTAVNDPPVITAVSNPQQSLHYSDRPIAMVITADDLDSSALTLSQGGGPTGLTISPTDGSACTFDGFDGVSCEWSFSGQILGPEGSYPITLSSDDGFLVDAASANIDVLAEAADVSFDENNAESVEVTAPGGTGNFSLTLLVKESEPDSSTGSPDFADISNAVVSVDLVPIAEASTLSATCSPNDVSGTGYAATLSVECAFSDVPVNVYTAEATVSGGFYVGGGTSAVTVFDPSLGSITGRSRFIWPQSNDNDKTHFNFFAKYLNNNAIAGAFELRRGQGAGQEYYLKNNSIESVALSPLSSSFGWSSFDGHATLKYPDGTSIDARFLVYVEDHGDSGDRAWVEVRDVDGTVIPEVSMPRPAYLNTVIIEGDYVRVNP